MSDYSSPDKPDHRIFASYPMPAKIDLIQERPRRESLIEQQLETQIGQQSFLLKNEVPKQSETFVQKNQWPSLGGANTASADLLDKEAKLLREIEEIERKPYNPQTMVVEREQWFEYPEGKPYDRHLTESTRRIKDFCSLPANMYPGQDRHIHEENLRINSTSPTSSSIHTAIIRSPRREVDNKSPLPFSFDNFTTKGVRGNIASVGAVEPERLRPPIYPIVKRSPTPT